MMTVDQARPTPPVPERSSGPPSVFAGSILDLTRKVAANDWEAITLFYRKYFDAMYQTAQCLTGRDEATCLDIVQDAMLKAIRSMREFENQDQLASWTRTVVRSVAYDLLRRESRQSARDRQAGQSASDHDVDWHVERQARLRWIEEQTAAMDPQQQKMFHLRYRLGWKLKRIADHFGLKSGAVDGRIRRMVNRLKRQAEREFEI